MWTDKYKKISYINIKIHYSVNFDLKCISLKTEHFPHPHTGRAVTITQEFGGNQMEFNFKYAEKFFPKLRSYKYSSAQNEKRITLNTINGTRINKGICRIFRNFF